MGSFSIWHWLIVLLVVVLIFGTKKLRNIGSDLGGAVKGFKEGMKGDEEAAQAGDARRQDHRRRSERQDAHHDLSLRSSSCSTSISPSWWSSWWWR